MIITLHTTSDMASCGGKALNFLTSDYLAIRPLFDRKKTGKGGAHKNARRIINSRRCPTVKYMNSYVHLVTVSYLARIDRHLRWIFSLQNMPLYQARAACDRSDASKNTSNNQNKARLQSIKQAEANLRLLIKSKSNKQANKTTNNTQKYTQPYISCQLPNPKF